MWGICYTEDTRFVSKTQGKRLVRMVTTMTVKVTRLAVPILVVEGLQLQEGCINSSILIIIYPEHILVHRGTLSIGIDTRPLKVRQSEVPNSQLRAILARVSSPCEKQGT
ncbi:unnamed protein product [Choristocarpus tenellus]